MQIAERRLVQCGGIHEPTGRQLVYDHLYKANLLRGDWPIDLGMELFPMMGRNDKPQKPPETYSILIPTYLELRQPQKLLPLPATHRRFPESQNARS